MGALGEPSLPSRSRIDRYDEKVDRVHAWPKALTNFILASALEESQ